MKKRVDCTTDQTMNEKLGQRKRNEIKSESENCIKFDIDKMNGFSMQNSISAYLRHELNRFHLLYP